MTRSDGSSRCPSFRRGAVLTFMFLLLQADRYHAFYCPRSSILLPLSHSRLKLYQIGPGSSGDYLSNLSSNDEQADGTNNNGAQNEGAGELVEEAANSMRKFRVANVQSAFNNAASSVTSGVGKRTSQITTGFATAFERGGSGIQSLANNAKNGAEQVTRKGSRDMKRTTIRAQKIVKRSTDGLAATGKGFSEIHFFEPVTKSISPRIQADEIVQWIDSQAKSGTQSIKSGTEWIDSQAKSGSKMVGSQAKTLVLKFTGKKDYEFGDVTKELVNRVVSHEVNMQDWILLLKILLALGTTVGPLAELLPFTFLVEALNMSMEQKVGGKVLEVLSKALDGRIVASLFSADDKSLIGDIAKRSVLKGVLEFTGKSDYQSGDIQRAVQQGEDVGSTDDMKLDLDINNAEFEEWDRLFVEKIETEDYVGNQAKIMDMKIAMALEECEAIARSKSNVGR